MLPFTQEKPRKINLGGTTLVSSQTEILHGAKLRRAEREESRRRHESALRIQSSWRSLQQSRITKKLLAEILQDDVLGINGMRALVFIGKDDVLLAQWSEAVISAGDSESSSCPIASVVRKYRRHFPIYSPFLNSRLPPRCFLRHAYSSSD
jgi:ubiquitin-protein ligase E3 C